MLTPDEIERLDRIEQKLDSLLALLSAGKQRSTEAPAGSFAYRRQQAINEFIKKGGKL